MHFNMILRRMKIRIYAQRTLMRTFFFSTTLLFLLILPRFIFAQEKNSYHVIIIGAGIAGLEAAHYLHEHHENNFIILEARDRIGGRAQTINIWNTALDLGASWIHGASPQNPILQLATKRHLNTVVSNMDAYTLYNAKGQNITDKEKPYINLYQQFKSYLTQQQNIDSNSKKSLSAAVVAFITLKHVDKTLQHGLLYEISSEIEQEYAADIKNLSLMWFDNDKDFLGPNLILTHGYKDIVDDLAEPFKNHILLKQVAREINYTQNKIIVTTQNDQQFEGKYIICTVPIGVLKAGTIKFIPQLPKDKLQAIHEHIGMGLLNRVIMRYPYVFWNNTEWIERISPAYWSHNDWANKGQWIEFLNMNYYIHQPILTALVSADFAKNLEQQSDQKIINSTMKILRTIYGNNIPNPSSFIVTRWGKDPYSVGSYSSLRPGALDNSEDYRIMAQPIKEHLLFAGEATNAEYPATTYGAYLSGQRAARFIIDHSLR